VQAVVAYPFEIPVRNPEFVKVGNTARDLGKLRVAIIRTETLRWKVRRHSPSANGWPLD
jgi:hypothetical protein